MDMAISENGKAGRFLGVGIGERRNERDVHFVASAQVTFLEYPARCFDHCGGLPPISTGLGQDVLKRFAFAHANYRQFTIFDVAWCVFRLTHGFG